MSVLLVAAKRELIESKLRLLTDAGLEPGIVDVDAFALHNAFEVNYPEAMRGIVGLVNIGHEVTNINILDDGVPILTRDITVGTRRFREDLQRERGISRRRSRAACSRVTIARAHLDAVLEIRAARRSPSASSAPPRSSHRRRAPRGRCAPIYTCGGGARIPGLTDALADRLASGAAGEPARASRVADGALDMWWSTRSHRC